VPSRKPRAEARDIGIRPLSSRQGERLRGPDCADRGAPATFRRTGCKNGRSASSIAAPGRSSARHATTTLRPILPPRSSHRRYARPTDASYLIVPDRKWPGATVES